MSIYPISARAPPPGRAPRPLEFVHALTPRGFFLLNWVNLARRLLLNFCWSFAEKNIIVLKCVCSLWILGPWSLCHSYSDIHFVRNTCLWGKGSLALIARVLRSSHEKPLHEKPFKTFISYFRRVGKRGGGGGGGGGWGGVARYLFIWITSVLLQRSKGRTFYLLYHSNRKLWFSSFASHVFIPVKINLKTKGAEITFPPSTLQGCALRKIEGSPVRWNCKSRVPGMWFVWKIWDFLVAQEQKLGARGHRALLEHSPDPSNRKAS